MEEFQEIVSRLEKIVSALERLLKPRVDMYDWDWLEQHAFPTFAKLLHSPNPPMISIFMSQLDPRKTYTEDAIRSLLLQAGFGPMWKRELERLQSTVDCGGHGLILQHVAGHYRLYEELIPMYERHFCK